jgi:propionate CoA-transferase
MNIATTSALESKLLTAQDAVALIPDGTTVASGGFVGAVHPEALSSALEQRFLTTAHPNNLTLVYAAGQGDGKTRGLNHLAHRDLLGRVIGGHWGLVPKLGTLAIDEAIDAYNFPQGVICQLFRDIAAGRPGCITHVGLDTFVDPLHGGGRLNRRTPVGLVERIELGGKPWLWYHSFPIHVGLLRASTADCHGNLIMDEEVMVGDVLAIAQAVHNSGGIVLAQVRRCLDRPAAPHRVRVPGILIDHIIVCDDPDDDELCSPDFTSSPSIGPSIPGPRLPLDERRIIAARACDEMPVNAVANIGIGIPEGVAAIAAERGLLESVTLTVECGVIGGTPACGKAFGASRHPQAIIDQPAQFDFYDGGGLDFAALGAAEIDGAGNVNVSRFGTKVAGVGGFINISQTAKRLVFCGTFTAGGLSVAINGGRLTILNEGRSAKFVTAVGQMSFNADRARRLGQEVLYITERAVFRLGDNGLELIEVAPGIDVQSQVLDLLPFRPHVVSTKLMSQRAFLP